jgi:hypothetical protein
MPITFNLISSATVSGSSTSSITFSSIPNSYTDLCLYVSSRAVASNYNLNYLVQYNSLSTSSSYNGDFAYYATGNATSVLNNQTQAGGPVAIITSVADSTGIANFFSFNWSYIGNYNSTAAVQERMYVGTTDASVGIFDFGHARPPSTGAITSLTIKELSSNVFIADSTFYLYGIKNS